MPTINDDFNPFIVMEQYTRESLQKMTHEQLIVAQRSVLYPHEREKFDNDEPIVFKSGDGREKFFDYTDRLICSFKLLGDM